MKKTIILFLILMIASLLAINIDFTSLFQKWKMKYYIHVLAKDGTVYAPNMYDLLYIVNDELLKNEDFEKRDIENKHLIKAMYALRDLPKDEIHKLMFSKHPNLRVYGYIYYLVKNQDVNINYLLQSFNSNDIVFLNHRSVYGECYVRDVLLLVALKGIDLTNFLLSNKHFLYDLTDEQIEILKTMYEENKSFNKDMDKIIGDYFELYWQII